MVNTNRAEIDWTNVLKQTDVNLAVDEFYNAFNETLHQVVPLKNQPNFVKRYSYPPWYASELIRFIKLKYFSLKKFKSHGLEYNWEVYNKCYRSLVNALRDRDYKEYLFL